MRNDMDARFGHAGGSVAGILIAVLLFAACTVAQGMEPYRLAAGDSVQIRIFGRPDLSGLFVVQETGDLAYPLLGSIQAAGSTARDLQGAIATRLAGLQGESLQVSVVVASYPPIYIDGDVMRPGAYPYRPGLSVTELVALAGGRYSQRASGPGASLRVSELQASFAVLLDTYWADVAREARILAQRAKKDRVTFPADLKAHASSRRVAEIINNEDRLFKTQRSSLAQRIATLKERRSRELAEIKLLEEQRLGMQKRRRLIGKQIEPLQELARRGVIPKAQSIQYEILATNLDQESRASALALVRARKQVALVEGDIAQLSREDERVAATNLQVVEDRLIRNRMRLEDIDARLTAMRKGLALEQSQKSEASALPIKVTHTDGNSIQVDESTELRPGDVVKVPFPELSPKRDGTPVLQLPGRAEIQ